MIYCFNYGIGMASSGIEYAQAYRAKIFREMGVKVKFIFTKMISEDNIQKYTHNIGFQDSEVEWLYTAFTDIPICSCSYPIELLENTFTEPYIAKEKCKDTIRFKFSNGSITAHFDSDDNQYIKKVDYVFDGYLLRRDYYSNCCVFSEFFAPVGNKGHLYLRRFYNRDGSVAFEEYIDDESVLFKFPDKIIYSEQELLGYYVSQLDMTRDDVVIIDRSRDMDRPIIENAGEARIGYVIHAEHYNDYKDEYGHILWNHHYEYRFRWHKYVDFYITSTEEQNRLLSEQFDKVFGEKCRVVTIPVGSIDSLSFSERRKKHSIITASRLAGEKHIDWIVLAIIKAHDIISDISLDIYGAGGMENRISELIKEHECESYIKMCGQHKLDNIYPRYEAYISASQTEGFGLSILEAVGAGLPIIGFNVPYGCQTFIKNGKNGYLIPYVGKSDEERIEGLTNGIVDLFSKDNIDDFSKESYRVAEEFLTEEVKTKWEKLLNQI